MSTWVCLMLLLGANAYDKTFDQGNSAYNEGDYRAAIDAYEQLIEESVVDPAVFYNLANAYYRTGRLGAAIANYERALQFAPGFDDAHENLATCVRETRQQLARPLPPDWEQSLLFWHYNLTPGTTRVLALLFWVTFWALLAIRHVRPNKWLLRGAAVAAVLALAFGLSAWNKAHGDLYAVADSEQVSVHYGTSEEETVRFYLYAGDRVLVDRRERGWVRVTTADGERGWAREDSLALVGPPYNRPHPTDEPSTQAEPEA